MIEPDGLEPLDRGRPEGPGLERVLQVGPFRVVEQYPLVESRPRTTRSSEMSFRL